MADVLDDATYVSGSTGVTRSGNTMTWTGALPQANDAANPIIATYVVKVDNRDPGDRQRGAEQRDHRWLAGR